MLFTSANRLTILLEILVSYRGILSYFGVRILTSKLNTKAIRSFITFELFERKIENFQL